MGLAVGKMVDSVVGALGGCLLVFHFPHELKSRHQLRLGIVGGGTRVYYLSRVASSPAKTMSGLQKIVTLLVTGQFSTFTERFTHKASPLTLR